MGAVDHIFDGIAELAAGAFFGLCHVWHVLCDVVYGFRKWGFRYGVRSLWKAVREFLAFLFAVPCRVLWLVLGFAGAALEDLAQCMLHLKYFMSYHVLRIDRWCLALALLGLSSSALAEGGTRWAFPDIPPVRHVDSESSVCVPITNGAPSQTEFGFDLEFSATASNNVAVAVGEDRDGDGDLSFSETDVVVGWDCGQYFLDRPKAGRRYESARYAEEKERTLSYVFRMVGLSGDLETFRVDTDEGVLGPSGMAATSEGTGLWPGTFIDAGDRHRVHWKVSRGLNYYIYGNSASVGGVSLSSGLAATAPDAVAAGGRIMADLFGESSTYVVYATGMYKASAGRDSVSWDTGYGSYYGSGTAGLYVDLVGAGDLSFSVGHGMSPLDVRVYVDGNLVMSPGSGRHTVHIAYDASAGGIWAWKPGWNMLRVTRRGRFPVGAGPSGGYTLRQRGGIIQLH